MQALIPLRHFLIPGNVNWTGEAERFSWRMKAATYEVGTMQVRIEDVGVDTNSVSADPGLPKWFDTQRVFENIDARRVRWADHEEIVVFHQPLFGERIVYNPAAAGATRGEENIVRRVRALWEASYAGRPEIRPCRRMSEAIGALLARKDGDVVIRALAPELRVARDAAVELEAGRVSDERANVLVASVRSALLRVRFAGRAAAVTEEMSDVAPLALDGASPASSGWYNIVVAEVFREDGARLRWIDRSEWRNNGPGGRRVLADFGRFTVHEWNTLTLAYLRADGDGAPDVYWNHDLELHPWQQAPIQSRPYRLYHYAQHVAERWETAFGRRPGVFVDSQIRLMPHSAQSLTDPRADLAAVQMAWFRHNEWITQVESLFRARAGAAGE